MQKTLHHTRFQLLIIGLFAIFPLREISAQHIFSKDDLVVGLNVGAVSYFGDLSIYDFEPLNKLRFESGITADLFISKQINQYLILKANFGSGNTKSNRPSINTSFYSRFNEVDLELLFSLKELIIPYSSTRIDFGIQAGYGIFLYRSISYNPDNMNVIKYNGLDQDRKKQGKANIGAGFSSGYYIAYGLTDKIILNQNTNFILLNTDSFDAMTGTTGINDRIMFLKFGIAYRITPSNFDRNRDTCPSFGEWNKFRRR